MNTPKRWVRTYVFLDTTLAKRGQVSAPVPFAQDTQVTIAPTADIEELLRLLRTLRAHMTESQGRDAYVCVACGQANHDGTAHDEDCEVAEVDCCLARLKGETDANNG